MGIPRLHQSIAKVLVTKCPAIALQQLEADRKRPTKQMERGTLVDMLVFGGASFHTVDARYKSGPRKGEPCTDWTGTEAKDEAKAARERGQVPVLPHELESAITLAGAIKSRMLQEGLDLARCSKQTTLQWTSRFGVECEGTPDLFFADTRAVTIDLKVGENADPDWLDDHIYNQGWDIQAAAYQEAVASNHPETDGRGEHWLVVADAATGCISVVPLSEAYMDLGRKRWERGQRLWVQCHKTGDWPEYRQRPLTPTKRIYWKEGVLQ